MSIDAARTKSNVLSCIAWRSRATYANAVAAHAHTHKRFRAINATVCVCVCVWLGCNGMRLSMTVAVCASANERLNTHSLALYFQSQIDAHSSECIACTLLFDVSRARVE